MKNKICIVGGGLAGLYFVLKLKGLLSIDDFSKVEITLFEKKSEFGQHIRCAQGVSLRWFKKYVPNYEEFVLNYVNNFEINSAYNYISDFSKEGEGAIIDRAKFEYYLGSEVSKYITVKKSEYVQSVVKLENGFSVLTEKGKYLYDYVIAADGVESRVSKSLGYFTGYKLDDIDVTSFKVIKHPEVNDSLLRFYLGKEIAPGGYLWVFPQGNNVANIGVCIDGKSSVKKSPNQYLDNYLKNNYIGCEILNQHVGAIPTPPFNKPIIADGFISIGDAGFGVNPISRAGIIEALSMANLAAEAFASGIENGDISFKIFKQYQKRWSKLKGKYYPYLYKLKKITISLDDRTMMSYKNVIESIPEKDRTMWKVLRMYLLRNPWLLWKMKSFWM